MKYATSILDEMSAAEKDKSINYVSMDQEIVSVKEILSAPLNTVVVVDTETFHKMVKSFKKFKYDSFPLELSPFACARKGWKCVGSNELECINCPARLQLFRPITADSLRTQVESLTNAHHKCCRWRSLTLPQWYTDPSWCLIALQANADKAPILHEFVTSVKAFLTVPHAILPKISFQTAVEQLGDKASALCSSIFPATPTEDMSEGTGVEEDAIGLALFGWRVQHVSSAIFTCSQCCRSLPGDMFVSRYSLCLASPSKEGPMATTTHSRCPTSPSSLSTNGSLKATHSPGVPAKRARRTEELDPMYAHWPWCPWAGTPGSGDSPSKQSVSPHRTPKTPKLSLWYANVLLSVSPTVTKISNTQQPTDGNLQDVIACESSHEGVDLRMLRKTCTAFFDIL